MKRRFVLAALVASLLVGSAARAQFRDPNDDVGKGAKLGKSESQRWQFGLTVTAANGPVTNLKAYLPVPADWPEQKVAVAQEEVSPLAKIRYETAEGGVKLMRIDIAQLPLGEQAKILVTYEIEKRMQTPPEDPSIFRISDRKKLPRDVQNHLVPSPKIESGNQRIKAAAKEAASGKETAWEKVEAIYDWARANVKHKKGSVKGAVAALRDGEGSVDDLTSLFIAMCRASNVPARTVWIPGHCYAEFYLADDEGKGHWFPCELVEKRAFGGIADPRPIIEKGDNFRAPYSARDRQRFLSPVLEATGTPVKKFIRQPFGGQQSGDLPSDREE
jgi:hypothetical protein